MKAPSLNQSREGADKLNLSSTQAERERHFYEVMTAVAYHKEFPGKALMLQARATRQSKKGGKKIGVCEGRGHIRRIKSIKLR